MASNKYQAGSTRRSTENVTKTSITTTNNGKEKEVLLPAIQGYTKIQRREARRKYLKEKRATKKEARKKRRELEERLGDAAPKKQVPHTLDSLREPDETMVDPDDEEVQFDEATDPMASYFRKEREPKVLITTVDHPGTKTMKLCWELRDAIPNSEFFFRNRAPVKRICVDATERGYTDIIIINDDRRKPNALLLIHLPDGPTAYFLMTSVKLRRDIPNCGEMTPHRPELILNNFNTRLGHVTARMLASVFHFDPQFRGRRVVTFHNQRDFIFFRNHRYEFRNATKVGIQELGPRFTLKLRSIQNGSFDSKYGEFEWVLKYREMIKNKRTFLL